MISTGFSGMVGCREVGIITASNLFQASVVFFFTRSDMMSLAVSDPAHKKCGDFHHTICNAVGTTSYVLPRDTSQPPEAGGK